MAEKTRVNLYMPTELKDYLLEEGEKLGFNLTTMILIACMEYRKTQQGIEIGGFIKSLSDGDYAKLQQSKPNDMKEVLKQEFDKIGYKLSYDADGNPVVSDK